MSAGAAPPLTGFGVAVTRAEPAGGPLARRLALAGARAVSWQAIEIAPPEDPRPLARAAAGLDRYDWVVFASARAVAALAAARPSASPARTRVAAVGRATAAAAERAGFAVARVPERAGAEALVAALRAAGGMRGARVLLPAGDRGRSELSAGLAELGADVDRVVAYRTLAAPLDAGRCRAQLATGEVAVVTFASPSAAGSVAAALGAEALRGARLVSIGPTTSRALRELGLGAAAEAEPSTLAALVAATIRAVSSGR